MRLRILLALALALSATFSAFGGLAPARADTPPPDQAGTKYQRTYYLPYFYNPACSCTILTGTYWVSFYINQGAYSIQTDFNDGHQGEGQFTPDPQNNYFAHTTSWQSKCNQVSAWGGTCLQWEWAAWVTVFRQKSCYLSYYVYINWDGSFTVTKGGDPTVC